MGDEQVDWVGLEEVIAAADRGLAPLGPEFAGFVVLEAATRVRDVGGGTLRASDVVVDDNGQVHLTRPPQRTDEARATGALRALLQRLLEVATSSTPALRACARRREAASIASLVRELEGALIPLNRAASRRGVARVAKATLDAIEAGQLPQVNSVHKNESSEPPPAAEPTPSPNATVTMEESTPCTAPGHWVRPMGEPPPVAMSPAPPPPVVAHALERPLHRAIEALEEIAGDEGESIEIVSNLPPIVDLSLRREDTPRGGFVVSSSMTATSAPTPRPAHRSGDRVEALLAGFQVSRLRDDPALSRDLKAMIGIETSMPPAVAPRTLFTNSESAPCIEVPVDAPEMDPDPTPITYAPRKKGGRALAFVTLATLGCALFAAGRTDRGRATIAKWLSPAAPPPGDVAPQKTVAPTANTASTMKLPTTCEAKLDLVGVPKGAEIARRLGTSPLSVAVPMHAALDVVATSVGSSPRRAHVEPSAPWQDDPTGPRLDLPLTLDVGDETKWPAPTHASIAAPTNGAKGMLRVTTNPSGATLWIIVESPTISGLPCGAPIELRVSSPSAAPRTVRVEWSAFSGAPPHATFTL